MPPWLVIFVTVVVVGVPSFPFTGAVWGVGGEGAGWGGREEISPLYRASGRRPRAGVEAASVFTVSWCLQVTTVGVGSVVSVFLNYLISCSVYMKKYLCILHQVSI